MDPMYFFRKWLTHLFPMHLFSIYQTDCQLLASTQYKWVFLWECIILRNRNNWWKICFRWHLYKVSLGNMKFLCYLRNSAEKKETKWNGYLSRLQKYEKVNCYPNLNEFEMVVVGFFNVHISLQFLISFHVKVRWFPFLWNFHFLSRKIRTRQNFWYLSGKKCCTT